jgi:hypothetical protein
VDKEALKEECAAGRRLHRLRPVALVLLAWLLVSCGGSRENMLRRTIAATTTGLLTLPPGVVTIREELVIPAAAHDLEIAGSGTTLAAAPDFKGRALLVIEGVRGIRLRDFNIDGGRPPEGKPQPVQEMIPPENALRVWYRSNGILADGVEGLEVYNLRLANVVSFPVLVSRSKNIRIHDVRIEDSGSKNARGRNNLTGGIVIEEGSSDFEVRGCTFLRVLGNGLWTHAQRTSRRLADGVLASNRFDTIGRDALQVGHATRVRVEDNSGVRIGYPAEAVDAENGGTPVGVDTAGNVDQSVYARNVFEEVNGKCFDLDGFHDGAVRGNRCTNRKRAEDYTFGHFGIVMNNTDPDVHSQNIEISGNVIDGAKFGALFLMGAGHRIVNNQFLHINQAQCNESAAKFGCIYKADEPEMLQSGIYLGRGVARMEETRGNVIQDNRISGFKMAQRCIAAAPHVNVQANTIAGNVCTNGEIER